MASPRLWEPLILGFAVVAMLISPTLSLNCTSQKFANKIYQNCSDLPELSASLHWTYDASNSSLSVAFVAPPAKSDGWIGWGINPNATGMVGTQALIAFKDTNGTMTVKPYRLNSYSSIEQTNLTFNVSDLSAESSGGEMRLFAILELPKTTTSTVNQVWQVGPSVTDGRPDRHNVQGANLLSKGTLNLVAQSTNGSTNATPGLSRIRKGSLGFSLSLFIGSFAFFYF